MITSAGKKINKQTIFFPSVLICIGMYCFQELVTASDSDNDESSHLLGQFRLCL